MRFHKVAVSAALVVPAACASPTYTCTKTTALPAQPTVTGLFTTDASPKTGFKLEINNWKGKNVKANWTVAADAFNPEIWSGQVGYLPNWPEAVFTQDSETGKLSIINAITAQQRFLSVGAGGANLSMRAVLGNGEAWVVCDPIKAGAKLSCRPSTAAARATGFQFWGVSDLICTNVVGTEITNHFQQTQPPTPYPKDNDGIDCDAFGSYDLIARPAVSDPKREYFKMQAISSNAKFTNSLLGYHDDYNVNTSTSTYTYFVFDFVGSPFNFDKEFFTGARRLRSSEPSALTNAGFAAVDLTKSPQILNVNKTTGSQQFLSCLVDSKSSELTCSVGQKTYPFYCPAVNDKAKPLLYGPCLRASDTDYSQCKILAVRLEHFTADLSTFYLE